MIRIFLKKTLRRYLVIGIIANLVLLAWLLLFDYKFKLQQTVKNLTDAPQQLNAIKKNINEMQSVVEAINDLYPYVAKQTARDALLIAVDNIKQAARSGEIMIKEIENDSNELLLPIDINLTASHYNDLVRFVTHIQTMTFPYAATQRLDIETTGEGRLRCSLKAVLRMPSSGGG
ncbi:MAG: hypothetical protein GY850_14855 [bacterium]|nr:hypothetical protein [bacterium]